MTMPVAVLVNLDVDVRSQPLGILMERLNHVPGVTVTLRRGRITPSRAWVSLELAGSSRAVDHAIRESGPWRT